MEINLTVCSLQIHGDSFSSHFKSFLKSWTIYSNINSRNLTAGRPTILWLLLPCSQFLKIGKIVFLSSHHLSSKKLLDLSLEAHLSGIFSGKNLGEKLGNFTDDWHCKHRTLGSKREKLLEKYTRTEEKLVDKNTWPSFSLQTNSKTEQVTFSLVQAWRKASLLVLGSLALGQHGCDWVTWALWTLMTQLDDGVD